MLIQVGRNSYRIVKKRAYKRRTLLRKNDMRKMLKYVFGLTVALTLITTAYAQIPPRVFTYNATVDAPEASKIDLKAKMALLADETPKEAIMRIAKENDFKQGELLVKIAFCESSLNPLAVNKNDDGTSDYGIFQFNSIHKFGELPLDLEWSIKKAIEWIKAGKLHAWNASANCWKRKNLTI